MTRPSASLAVRLGGLALVVPILLAAQGRARLRVTGGPITFNAPTVADFDNGYIDAPSSVTYTVSGVGAKNNHTPHTTIISIRANSGTLNGSVPVSDLQWRRSDLVAWNPLTTSNVQVESRLFVRNTTNDPWANALFFRLALSYAGDPPGAYSTKIILTLTATTP